MIKYKFKKFIHWLLLVIISLYVISGLGITYFRIVEKITFGVLNKSLAFKIHADLLIPFLFLLILHIYLVLKNKRIK